MNSAAIDDLRRAAQAVREFTLPLGPEEDGRTITLRTPTPYEVRLAALRTGATEKPDPAALVVLERSLLQLGVIGWAGLRQSDIVPGGTADLLEFDAQITDLLLDAQPEWCKAPVAEMYAKLAARAAIRDEAQKN